jgi:hypothetical protein
MTEEITYKITCDVRGSVLLLVFSFGVCGRISDRQC